MIIFHILPGKFGVLVVSASRYRSRDQGFNTDWDQFVSLSNAH